MSSFFNIIKKLFRLWVVILILLGVSFWGYWCLNATGFKLINVDIERYMIYNDKIDVEFHFPGWYTERFWKFIPYKDIIRVKYCAKTMTLDSILRGRREDRLIIPQSLKSPLNQNEDMFPLISISINAKHDKVKNESFHYNGGKETFFKIDSNYIFPEGTIVYSKNYTNCKLHYDSIKQIFYLDSIIDNKVKSTLYKVPTEESIDICLMQSSEGNYFTTNYPRFYLNIKFFCNKKIVLEEVDFSGIKVCFKFGSALINMQSISPEPDVRMSNEIIFNSPHKIKQVFKNGILLYGDNLQVKEFYDKLSFILATFIGILLSSLTGLIIHALKKDKKKVAYNISKRKSSIYLKRKRL